jgi:predicted membrane protein
VGRGRVAVIVPEGLDVDVEGQAGLGDAEVFGDRQEGAGVNLDASHDGGVGVPEIMLDIQVGLGEIDVVVDTNGADR